MQRSSCNVSCLTVREFVAIHMMAVVSRPDPHFGVSHGSVSAPPPALAAARAIELTDALLAELSKEKQDE